MANNFSALALIRETSVTLQPLVLHKHNKDTRDESEEEQHAKVTDLRETPATTGGVEDRQQSTCVWKTVGL